VRRMTLLRCLGVLAALVALAALAAGLRVATASDPADDGAPSTRRSTSTSSSRTCSRAWPRRPASCWRPGPAGRRPPPARARAATPCARDLLREAGQPEGFDVRMDCVDVAFREHVCQAIAAMLTQVGIRTELPTSPGTPFFPMITQAKVSLAQFGFTAPPRTRGSA